MTKRLAALTLAGMLCLCLLTGCKKDAVNFIYYTSDAITTLDPQLASTPAELTAVKNMFAGLYRLDEAGRAAPDRAQETEVSADGLVYTFTLDPDDVFTDGDKITVPVTARDYVFALQRLLDPATGAPSARSFLSIRGAAEVLSGAARPASLGVRAVSDTVLEITLSTPDDGLPAKLASAGAMPCNEAFFDSTAGAYGLSVGTVLGNGAFQPTAWSAASGLTLRRLRGDENDLVNRIRLVPDDGGSTAAERLAEGQQDGALASADQQSQLSGYPSQTFETTVWTLVFNCADDSLTNLSIRQALASVARLSAEDLSGLVHLRAADGLVPGSAQLTGGSPYRDAVGDAMPSLAEAQSYSLYRLGLSELGVERLSGLQVLIPETEPWGDLYPIINQRWQRSLSAFFSVQALPESELLARVRKGEFDIALIPLSMTSSGPETLLTGFLSDEAANPARYHSTAFDSFARQGLSAAASAAQAAAWGAAERQLLGDAAVAPLAFQSSGFYLAPDLKGVVVSPFGPVIDLTGASRK
ncbi:peptide ABC transporter substrate-binding protein [Anaerofilum sp. BX8]|uniref:Peptide ABC transporter substrate-binding protein n=1 Tax=Anaerofilum hominis TaxID=2763016 RepID=A0A923I6C7_9FIRM|nr:peptide ABC transporter substrate-binding protein [Anaerofilum hominis]MBC5581125.1 peptide ABC transporter substrate-binding protein [Anaerofilum hominis]